MARLRTFLAVDLDELVRGRAVDLQDALAESAEGVKWVEAENLHVTLLFLGEVADRDLPAVCQAAARACRKHAPFALRVESLSCFGNPRRPRTIWVGVGDGTPQLCALHADLETALLELGCYRREDRPFTPHITLGRVKKELASEAFATALTKHAKWKGGVVDVDQVLVMSSELRSDGPEYTVLSRARLG
jgi:2'-5' RNA ligase